MTGPDQNLPSLEDLQHKIDEANIQKGVKKEGESESSSTTGMGAALQVGVELVSGVAVGSLIGYFLDRWLGTMPLFFITCFFIGAAAGFKNLVRNARRDTGQEIK